MFGFGKKKKEEANNALTHTGKSLARVEESTRIIEETLKPDIRSFFSNGRNLETLVSKMKNEELQDSLGMMAIPPTEENLAKAKVAADKIKKLYAKALNDLLTMRKDRCSDSILFQWEVIHG